MPAMTTTTDPLAILAEIKTAARRHRLTLNQIMALHYLIHIRSARMCDIQTELNCHPSDATRVVDQLEALALVKRQTTATDRRAILVGPTPRGAEVLQALNETLRHLLAV